MPWHIVSNRDDVILAIIYKGRLTTDPQGSENTHFRIVVTLDGEPIGDTGERTVSGRIKSLPIRPLFLAPCVTGGFELAVEGVKSLRASYHQKALRFAKNFPTRTLSGALFRVALRHSGCLARSALRFESSAASDS